MHLLAAIHCVCSACHLSHPQAPWEAPHPHYVGAEQSAERQSDLLRDTEQNWQTPDSDPGARLTGLPAFAVLNQGLARGASLSNCGRGGYVVCGPPTSPPLSAVCIAYYVPGPGEFTAVRRWHTWPEAHDLIMPAAPPWLPIGFT